MVAPAGGLSRERVIRALEDNGHSLPSALAALRAQFAAQAAGVGACSLLGVPATTYSLRAVVWHRGGDASFGHYLADVQRARGAAEYWERYDDTAVTRRAAMITPATAVGPHATAVTNGYLFFYVSDGLGL
ncbi:hypothetical protein EMIHUDRAFT_247588 [Emiliania huxleyi CCMP1516]|uniref:USP domain-containing protein n=2 Tax=Emiliania huxleyi TaxID=2903 RepID=A0A0D3I1C9_EMIH1|nr:hypothetical protein EMIHUDRAFT_250325 [Emiliania huxleyi CCMP1516]XP_005764467.1 hypothetical protein EMIHUDRAFT_247588 [Emiliania huxleyi CCMP1516]EOD05064.1 hypothetical protein EMIHUDRAFT_250325 [Emiliania huxleyi CCMP1516]EOD12038.1 hypothetical protein EMIHUDRAFT_247588 [Emiliania huxleyi CCMP1516]|eukprot:XP_005757493.1 hypothetical protein EMIHUDRAFT_250325 [Emiliania huxleyi CCMP1516]